MANRVLSPQSGRESIREEMPAVCWNYLNSEYDMVISDEIFVHLFWGLVLFSDTKQGLQKRINGITMTSKWPCWRLKSPASRLFNQSFIQALIKVNIKAPRHWPLCGKFTGDRWISRTNGQLRGKFFHMMTSSWVCKRCSNNYMIVNETATKVTCFRKPLKTE